MPFCCPLLSLLSRFLPSLLPFLLSSYFFSSLLFSPLPFSPLPFSFLLSSPLPFSPLLFPFLFSSPLPFSSLLSSSLIFSPLPFSSLLFSFLLSSSLFFSYLLFSGTVAQVQTPATVRAKELLDLYKALSTPLTNLSEVDARLDVLLHVKVRTAHRTYCSAEGILVTG